ncbi:MAG: hypothetical protein ACK5CO_02385 [Bacteroidota bacterium]
MFCSCIPILGDTKAAQLLDNMGFTEVCLSSEHMQKLNEASNIELGFPGDFLKEEGVKQVTFGGFYNKIEHPQILR